MRSRSALWIVVAALLAGGLGLAASVALHGPGPLLSSPLGQWALHSAFSSQGSVGLGDPVKSWRLPTLEGGERQVPATGQVTLVNYWASWCRPCIEELPLLVAAADAPDAGFALVPIALDSAADARAFVAAHRLPGPVPVENPGPADSSVRLGNRAGVLPFSALVGADGRLKAVRIGPFTSRADLQAWLAAAETGR